MSAGIVYALTDPRIADATMRVRYVGKTERPAAMRLRDHISRARNGGRTHRDTWIRQVLAAGTVPGIEVLMEAASENLPALEILMIFVKRAEGSPLTNLTLGGDGVSGFRLPREAIERMAAKKRGRQLSPAHREKLAAHWARWRANADNEAARKSAHAAALTGVPRTQAVRDKVSAAKSGRVVISEEQRAAISRSLTGRTQSVETRERRAASFRAFLATPAGESYRQARRRSGAA